MNTDSSVCASSGKAEHWEQIDWPECERHARRLQARIVKVSCINQSWKRRANKTGMGLEDWAMQQHDGFGFGIGGVAEVVDVAVGTEATDDGGAGRRVNGLAE